MNLYSTPSGAHFDHLWAVVVAYHPDIPSLKQLCVQLQLSGAQVVVIDNTESPKLKTLVYHRVRCCIACMQIPELPMHKT